VFWNVPTHDLRLLAGSPKCESPALGRRVGIPDPEKAVARLHTLCAGLTDSASLEHPDAITQVGRTLDYARDLTVDLDPG